MATADVPEQALRRRVDPAHDSGRVEHIARHVDAVQCLLDVPPTVRPLAIAQVWLIPGADAFTLRATPVKNGPFVS